MYVNRQNKFNLKTNIITLNEMFDLDKLIEEDPKMFKQLSEKYPLKDDKCIYIIQYINKISDESEDNECDLRDEPFPEDFQPLYKVGEEIKIHVDKHYYVVKIVKIRLNNKVYYYECTDPGGDTRTYHEDFLVEHESE